MDFVLLHGTVQAPAGWERLAGALEARGHRAFTVDFPTGEPGLLADDYAAIAAGQVAVREAVVVAHSGAGLLLPAVAEAMHASRLVWLAAAVPDFGGASFARQSQESAPDIAGEEWLAFGHLSTDDPVVAAYFGFHDCDLETLRWALTTMRLFFPEAVYAQDPPSARPPVPSTFVLPRHDRTLRPDWMRKIARERLGIDPVEVDGGHFPHVSRPVELAEILAG